MIVIEENQREQWEQIHVVDLKSETALHKKKWIIREAAINSDF